MEIVKTTLIVWKDSWTMTLKMTLEILRKGDVLPCDVLIGKLNKLESLFVVSVSGRMSTKTTICPKTRTTIFIYTVEFWLNCVNFKIIWVTYLYKNFKYIKNDYLRQHNGVLLLLWLLYWLDQDASVETKNRVRDVFGARRSLRSSGKYST